EAALLAQKQLFEDLVTVARRTAEQPGLDATLRNVLGMSLQLTGAEGGSLVLFDQMGAVTHSLQARGDRVALQHEEIAHQGVHGGLAGWMSRERRPAMVADTFHDERWLPLPNAPELIRSALAV